LHLFRFYIILCLHFKCAEYQCLAGYTPSDGQLQSQVNADTSHTLSNSDLELTLVSEGDYCGRVWLIVVVEDERNEPARKRRSGMYMCLLRYPNNSVSIGSIYLLVLHS